MVVFFAAIMPSYSEIRDMFLKYFTTCIYLIFLNLCLTSYYSAFIAESLVLVISLMYAYGIIYLLFLA